MFSQLLFIITASLFDSFSTTQQIVIFVLILTTTKPIKNSLSYLAGLTASYFACGIGGYLILDKLNAFIAKIYPGPSGVSDVAYYQVQIFIGVICVAGGLIYFIKKKDSTDPPMENVIISMFKHMNALVAFGIGVIISVTGFPLALPYIAVLGKVTLLKTGMPEIVGWITLYNIFYALPMMVIFVIYFFGSWTGREDLEARLNERARKLNLRLTCAMFVGLGLLSMADALFYFLIGHPMFSDRFF